MTNSLKVFLLIYVTATCCPGVGSESLASSSRSTAATASPLSIDMMYGLLDPRDICALYATRAIFTSDMKNCRLRIAQNASTMEEFLRWALLCNLASSVITEMLDKFTSNPSGQSSDMLSVNPTVISKLYNSTGNLKDVVQSFAADKAQNASNIDEFLYWALLTNLDLDTIAIRLKGFATVSNDQMSPVVLSSQNLAEIVTLFMRGRSVDSRPNAINQLHLMHLLREKIYKDYLLL